MARRQIHDDTCLTEAIFEMTERGRSYETLLDNPHQVPVARSQDRDRDL